MAKRDTSNPTTGNDAFSVSTEPAPITPAANTSALFADLSAHDPELLLHETSLSDDAKSYLMQLGKTVAGIGDIVPALSELAEAGHVADTVETVRADFDAFKADILNRLSEIEHRASSMVRGAEDAALDVFDAGGLIGRIVTDVRSIAGHLGIGHSMPPETEPDHKPGV